MNANDAMPKTRISGDITLRCPQCKAVVAWEHFNEGRHVRSWAQQTRLALSFRWPFVRRVTVPYEPKCPNGCQP